MGNRNRKSQDTAISRLSPLEISRVALGVRFEPQFRILDDVGALVDRILRARGTPFGPSTFPAIRSNPLERVLVNDDTGDSLVINSRDAILDMAVNSRDLGRIANLATNFQTFVLSCLREVVDLKSIERYGVLLRLSDCRSHLAKTPIEHYLRSDFENARSLVLRFTRRLPTVEARVKRDVEDYRSAIYTIQQADDGKVEITVDYQEYFRPPLDSAEWCEKPFDRFVERGTGYFEGEFKSWLKKLTEESEVA